jgi:SOS-response transcriptional repressor LexA
MTPDLCDNWTDLNDLDFPRKICNRFEYARTDDPRAFYFEAHLSAMNMIGLRDGDLLLVEPSRAVDRGSIVLSVRGGKFRLIKILPRNGEVILQPLEESGELEIVRRKEVLVFAVSELKRSLVHN